MKKNKSFLFIGIFLLVLSYSETLLIAYCKNKYTDYVVKTTTKYDENHEIIGVWEEVKDVRSLESSVLCNMVDNNNFINEASNIVVRITGYLIVVLSLFSTQLLTLKKHLIECIEVLSKLRK